MRSLRTSVASATALFVLLSAASPLRAEDENPKYSAKAPPSLQMPEEVESRIGMLKFFDGLPDGETTAKVYDNLDFVRGIDAFLSGIPIASVQAVCTGLEAVGVAKNRGLAITDTLMDARSLFLTPDTAMPYVIHCIDLTNGPVVVEVPPAVSGAVDDAGFRFVTAVGMDGPDQGKGGRYLFLPPGYTGEVPPEGYFVVQSKTNNLVGLYHPDLPDGDVARAVRGVREKANVYPFSAAANPPPASFVDISGAELNAIHASDFHFYEQLNAAIQAEPGDAFDPELAGLFASIGIQKGKPFEPNDRMKEILTDAATVANATARAIVFAPRDPAALLYEDRQWLRSFVSTSHDFLDEGARLLDARAAFHYRATGITPSMTAAKPGSGSASAYTARDSKGEYLDGGKTYKITLPAPVPAGNFWSLTAYDTQTRSILETGQKRGGVASLDPAIKANQDGSYTIWFGPEAPEGMEGNWVQTTPEKSWYVLLRLYAPLEPWFERSWRPGDFEVVD